MVAAVGLDHPHRGRGEFADAREDRAGGRDHGVEGHVTGQGLDVERAVGPAHGDEGGKGGGEAEPRRGLVEVEGLDAEAVPRQHEAAAVPLGEGEGEHAEEVVDASGAPLTVGLGDHLGVGVGEEAVAQPAELLAQVAVVVDAAVEDDGQTQLGIDHGLGAGRREVDDGEPPMGQGHRARRPDPRAVGTSGGQAVRAPLEGAQVGGTAVEATLTDDSAHRAAP